jgi:hypothetical protein
MLALPTTPDAVATYLTSLAGRLGPSGLRRRLAAIADRHRRGGLVWDPAHPVLHATLRDLVVALDREQLRFTPTGMSVETAEGVLAVSRTPDSARCPVRALAAWLRQARIAYGAVFRRVTAAGTLEDRLSPQGVWRILRRRAALAKSPCPPEPGSRSRGCPPVAARRQSRTVWARAPAGASHDQPTIGLRL